MSSRRFALTSTCERIRSVSCVNASPILEFTEHILDFVALTVERFGFWGFAFEGMQDHCNFLVLSGKSDASITVM